MGADVPVEQLRPRNGTHPTARPPAGSDILGDPAGVQPADLLERLPQLARLVHVDLAGLLGVGLAELLADAQGLDALDEDASLGGQVGGTVEPQVAGEQDLVRIEQVGVRVAGQVEGHAAPLHLEGIRSIRQAGQGRAVVWEAREVLVLTDDPLRRIRRGPRRLDSARSLGRARRRWCLADAGGCVGVVAASGGDRGIAPGLAAGLEVSAFSLEPQARVHAEGLGDLRLELEGEGVVAGARKGGLAEAALHASSHMVLDDAVGERLVGREEGRLGRCRRLLAVRVEDGVSHDRRLLVRRDALDDLGGGRDGGRNGEAEGRGPVDGEEGLHLGVHGVLDGRVREALVGRGLRRRHEAAEVRRLVLEGHDVDDVVDGVVLNGALGRGR